MTRIIAHRGCSRAQQENSLTAFAAAVASGADALEVDLRKSADGEIYCYHDRNLSRLTGYNGEFERTDSAVIAGLAEVLPLPILPFSTFLEEFGGKIGLVLDIKSAGIEERIVELTAGLPAESLLVYSSFEPSILAGIKALKPEARLALIVGPLRNLRPRFSLTDYLLEKATHLGCRALHLSKLIAVEKLVAGLRERDFGVSVWTVDDGKTALKFQSWGVEGIITNTPETLKPELAASAGNDPGSRSRMLRN